MSELFNSGVRPIIDAHIDKLAEEKRDYGDFWSASSAGYCMRKVIFDRLQLPQTTEATDKARKQRIFSAGHIFHEWAQRITKDVGMSIAQELELQDEDLMIRGHIDDLILVNDPSWRNGKGETELHPRLPQKLILYDYKTRNSKNFGYSKVPSFFHKMQTGTYMYMLRNSELGEPQTLQVGKIKHKTSPDLIRSISEARVLNISKDDLRMSEVQYLYSDELEKEILNYWKTLNKCWADKKLPKCTCHEQAGGFMAKEKWNPYFYEGEPCSVKWLQKHPELAQKWRDA